jgi:hypothetical protein
MSSQDQLNPEAARLAVIGMRSAYERNFTLCLTESHDLDGIGTSAVDFTNWACALEERLRETAPDGEPAFQQRRDADADGVVLEGLRFVRDRHIHQLVVSAVRDSADFFSTFPPQLSAGIVWRSVDEIPEPSDALRKKKYHYVARRTAYEDHLQNQPTWLALRSALRWLTAETNLRQVALPVFNEP